MRVDRQPCLVRSARPAGSKRRARYERRRSTPTYRPPEVRLIAERIHRRAALVRSQPEGGRRHPERDVADRVINGMDLRVALKRGGRSGSVLAVGSRRSCGLHYLHGGLGPWPEHAVGFAAVTPLEQETEFWRTATCPPLLQLSVSAVAAPATCATLPTCLRCRSHDQSRLRERHEAQVPRFALNLPRPPEPAGVVDRPRRFVRRLIWPRFRSRRSAASTAHPQPWLLVPGAAAMAMPGFSQYVLLFQTFDFRPVFVVV